jgi:hypothetical protein
MSPLRRRRLALGLLVAAAAALFAGPLAQSASAAQSAPAAKGASAITFFRAINNDSANPKRSLAISSSQNNTPLVMVPKFVGKFVCATCGIANIPEKQQWTEERLESSRSAVFLVNRETRKCADVEPDAQKPGADALGARVVIAACDGTASQRWKNNFQAGGNTSHFVNELTGLILTDNAAEGVVLEKSNSAFRTVSERIAHQQTFTQTQSAERE